MQKPINVSLANKDKPDRTDRLKAFDQSKSTDAPISKGLMAEKKSA